MSSNELKRTMKLRSNLIKRSVETLPGNNLKDLISLQKRSRRSLHPDEHGILSDLKYANQSPIVRTASNQMYSIGLAQRFIRPPPK